MTKLIALLAILLLPCIIFVLKAYPHQRKFAFLFLSALSLLPNVPIGFVYGWPHWHGTSLGFSVPFSLIIGLSLIFTNSRKSPAVPFRYIILFYIFCIFASIFSSRMWLPSSFTLWQVVAVSVIFFAVATEAHKAIVRDYILIGFATSLIFQAANSIFQRIGGAAQASGTFGHQNILGLAVELTWIPLLAAALASKRSYAELAGIAAGAVCVASSGSRATMGIAAASVLVLAACSVSRRITPRKIRAISVGLILIGVATPFALGSLNARFQGETYFTPDFERMRFEEAASKMAERNPFGVGANNYVFVSNTEGYADNAGIGWQFANRTVPVHNAYLLSRAETGLIGQISFVTILVFPALWGLYFAFRERRSGDGDILIGLSVGLIANIAHNFYEFAVHTFHVQSLLFINIGLISALIRIYRPRLIRNHGITAPPYTKTR